ncbi:unnamed protein product [Toxocara canis]|uniref:Uncharacterized protein n=1 Tax=Toxocara canis TaxID=6265 RepID=A0A3P7H4H2_TOXCA|nr:unnamed protein product [Toxocara canis]
MVAKIVDDPVGPGMRRLHTFLKDNPDARKYLDDALKKFDYHAVRFKLIFICAILSVLRYVAFSRYILDNCLKPPNTSEMSQIGVTFLQILNSALTVRFSR